MSYKKDKEELIKAFEDSQKRKKIEECEKKLAKIQKEKNGKS